ncbi:Plastidal glycolate/glycerate translocator 1, chloroplastic [Vitis vinifera]|uniref:Plastidal glycolate/glycerate translocator 1, chloroplastic n=1 Tax=Vitis vinifera TaxID=29760 RepID=A0A438I0T0_VITVI|nr:Plastidal glycolate/glycerate translocator 1, chloroplastic [Vitis vinifera]
MATPSAISRNLPLSLSNPRSPPTLVASCLTSLSNFPRLPPHVASNQQSYFPKLSVPSRVDAPASKFLQMGPHKSRPLRRFQVFGVLHLVVSLGIILAMDKLLKKAFVAAAIKFPSALFGMFCIFTILVILDSTVPAAAKSLMNFFQPALLFIQRWLPLFYVPSLVVLPLAVKDIPAASGLKICFIIEGVGGISVSLIMMNWRGGYSYLRSKATSRVEWTSPPFGCIRLILTVKFGLAIEAEAFLYWMVAVTMRKWGYIHGYTAIAVRKIVKTEMIPAEPMEKPSPFTSIEVWTWTGICLISFVSALLYPTLLGTNARTCLPFLLASTVLGYVVGSGFPSTVKKVFHPIICCALSADLAALAFGYFSQSGLYPVLGPHPTYSFSYLSLNYAPFSFQEDRRINLNLESYNHHPAINN